MAVDEINALATPPDFLLHTGDLTHLSKPEEFDTVDQILKGARQRPARSSTCRASTTSSPTTASSISTATAKGRNGEGWHSFDYKGVHFIGLVNVRTSSRAGSARWSGADRVAEKGSRWARASTPIVVYAHVPLWTVYPKWGWGTEDSAQALALLKRFGSVTVLNGHIHQVLQKIEGNITFHTACSTAFPQPVPAPPTPRAR